MAPAARSPIFKKDMRPEDLPPPESFSFSPANWKKMGPGAGAIFEEPRLSHPKIHDAAVVDEIIGDGLDETGMRLRMLVGRLRLDEFLGLVVDIIMALARPIDAIGPMEPGIEPLRRIGR